MKHSPPKLATRLLRWYCNPAILEEVEGDAKELFLRRVIEQGSKKASLLFVWDVIRFFRWSNIKRTKSLNNYNNNLVLLDFSLILLVLLLQFQL